jgi:integrase
VSRASILSANGVDLATVSERLGHSSVRVTAEIYPHAIRGRDRRAADLWDAIKGREGAARQTAKGVN